MTESAAAPRDAASRSPVAERSSGGAECQIARVAVRLAATEHVFDCAGDMTLLEAAEAVGLMVPHSCREGHCGSCIVTLKDGTVASSPGSALSRRDRLKGRILACQSRPTSARIVLDYDA